MLQIDYYVIILLDTKSNMIKYTFKFFVTMIKIMIVANLNGIHQRHAVRHLSAL